MAGLDSDAVGEMSDDELHRLDATGNVEKLERTLYRLRPEVAGDWGPSTVVTNREAIESGQDTTWDVAFLEYRFITWLGDELLTAHPCYIVTDGLADHLASAGLTGVAFSDVKISRAGIVDDLNPDRKLPPFRRLVPTGRVRQDEDGTVRSWTGDDVSLTERGDLVVTERCLEVLRLHRIDHCEIEPLTVRG